jgi:hypothetical protein
MCKDPARPKASEYPVFSHSEERKYRIDSLAFDILVHTGLEIGHELGTMSGHICLVANND